jgi:predicted alpha/beta superfamily hydrolase
LPHAHIQLLARRRGFEAIVVGIDNGGAGRTRELSPWTNAKHGAAQGEQYMAFVVDTVKPWVDAHYRTQPGRADTAIVGSSMGGLISTCRGLAVRLARAGGRRPVKQPRVRRWPTLSLRVPLP